MENYFFYAIAGIEILLPLACILWIIAVRATDIFAWLFQFLTSALWFNAAFLALPWAYTSIYLRWVFLLIFIGAAVWSFMRIRNRTFYVRKGFSYYLGMTYVLISMGIAALINVSVIGSFFTSDKAYEIASPLQGSGNIVIQGGNSGVTNLFHQYFKQRNHAYALDIVKLSSFGNRATAIAPDSLAAYKIYGDSIFCPCTGILAEARAGILDNMPGEVNSRQILGNYVKINCGEFYVTLAHFQHQSLKVRPDQKFNEGDFIGLVGNSGHSVEPHLHMEGYILSDDSTEVSVPLLINGRFLGINNRIK